MCGDVAASIWHQLRRTRLASIEYRVLLRPALPVDQLDRRLAVQPPDLIMGYRYLSLLGRA